MISYIRGTLAEVQGDMIVVSAGAVGVNIHVPLSVVETLPPVGKEVMIYTYLKVAEDALTLYGFNTRRDLEMFRQLLNVSGVGPKGALAVLSVLTPDDLRIAVFTGDSKAITRAPGIGVKTAQRMILDLKDRVSPEDIMELEAPASISAGTAVHGPAQEAAEALVQLGYSPADAGRAIRSVENSGTMDAEALLKAALKQFRF